MKFKVIKTQNNAGGCIVCGTENKNGLHFHFYELENGTLAGVGSAKDIHQSYPGRVHGGMISSLLDEVMGRAIQISEPDTWAVTAEMTVRFKAPVPYNEELILLGEIEENNKRIFNATGSLYLEDGTLAATATGKYVKLPISKISEDFANGGDKWETDTSHKSPAFIDIPIKEKA